MVCLGDSSRSPRVLAPDATAGLGQSLLSRLAAGGAAVHRLREQHRMHTAIAYYPARKWYAGAVAGVAAPAGVRMLALKTISSEESFCTGAFPRRQLHCLFPLSVPSEPPPLLSGSNLSSRLVSLVVCELGEKRRLIFSAGIKFLKDFSACFANFPKATGIYTLPLIGQLS